MLVHRLWRRDNISPVLATVSCLAPRWIWASVTGGGPTSPQFGSKHRIGSSSMKYWIGLNGYCPAPATLAQHLADIGSVSACTRLHYQTCWIPEQPILPSFPVLLCHFCWLMIHEVNVWLAADDINFTNTLNTSHHISPHHNQNIIIRRSDRLTSRHVHMYVDRTACW